uniref:Uncharacterized protein n=1 Tax=Haemonchus placei TaxID=6290 RepID=A0A0N4W1X2_HAEPC
LLEISKLGLAKHNRKSSRLESSERGRERDRKPSAGLSVVRLFHGNSSL